MSEELKKLEELLANDRKIIEENYKEIERLKELCDKYEEEHKTTFEEWKKTINIVKEVREYIVNSFITGDEIFRTEILEILDKEGK